ncbi:MAG: polyphosphate kinase 1 [Xanthomonadales bacterium]|nr:polyphosphate kinase 1 [Xanthomonadales bacterium]
MTQPVAQIAKADAAPSAAPVISNLRDRRLYLNRELNLLQFNHRVLHQAVDPRVPLLERLRFLGISCLLLDEYFEVRVAGLKQRIIHGTARPGPDGLTPRRTLELIREHVQGLVERQYEVFNDILKPELESEQIRFLAADQWTARQRKWLHAHFRRELLPVLSPLGLDPVHPFPRILTKSLNFAVELEGRDAFGREAHMALVRAPRSLKRLIRIPRSYSKGPNDFVFLSAVLQTFMDELFPGMNVTNSFQFRVTRDSELLVDEEEVEDLANALEGELQERGFSAAVRLETTTGCSEQVVKYLAREFELTPDDVYACDGPVNLNRLTEAIDRIDRPDLKYPVFKPAVQPALTGQPDYFSVIRHRDLLFHHPYESFQPILDLLRQAARDPEVLAIKQTLYRTGIDSQVVNALIDAARAGKDVTVVVELRARFDEAANIRLASRLQQAGVQVVYGVVGHKAHAKMLLIVRRERRQIRRYVHLGTGNYHSGTASLYTDFGLMTVDPAIGEDVHRVFQQLSGLGKFESMNRLLVSPFTLHKQLLKKIRKAAKHARAGGTARIDAKMNALTEPKVIRALYDASQAGVQIRLVVRGVCCLRPGVEGFSDNIRVRSVIGRFLEHARVVRFQMDDKVETWCSSADWMERNLFQRVEVAFPVLDEGLAERIHEETLALPWEDGMQAWEMQPDGSYQAVPGEDVEKPVHPHRRLLKLHQS